MNQEQIPGRNVDPFDLFESLFMGAGTGMVLFDLQGNINRVNRVFVSTLGYEAAELQHMNYLDLILPEIREQAEELFRKMANGSIAHHQTRQKTIRKDGKIMEIELTFSVAPDRKGKPAYILGMAENITDMVRSEKITQVLFNISAAVNSSKDLKELIAVIQEELGRIIDTSNFFVALYDRETDSLSLPYFADDQDHFEVFPAGKTASAYVINMGRPVLLKEEDMERLEEEGLIELVGTRSKIWMGVPLKVKNEIIGLIGLQHYRDENAYNSDDLNMMEFISGQIGLAIDRKRTEDELKMERVFFMQIFENSPEAIVIGNRTGNIINVNKGFTHLFGYSKEEVTGKNINDLITPAELKNETLELRNIIGRNEMFFLNTVRNRKDGTPLNVSLLGSPFEVNGQELSCVIYRDISDQKKIEEKLMQAKEKAEESDRLKTAFLANMSHEIRTPMNAIIGFTELLSVPDLPDEDKNDYIAVIKSSGNILLKLIDDIIDLAKIEADQIKIEISTFRLNQLLKEVYAFYNEEILNLEKKDIELIFEPGESDEFFITSDPFRLKQILNNLVGNAIKFTENGSIRMGYRRSGPEKVRFFVEDTGIGIPEDKHKLIFNRFLQADNTKTRKYGGTGLGLTISKKLVNLMGGEIGLDSCPGKGSTFYFTISTNLGNDTGTTTYLEEPAGLDKIDLNDRRLLVVEDNQANFQLIREILRNSGADVLWAEDAASALELLQEQDQKVDMVLMDVQMPGINGYEATRIIRDRYPDIPVVAQTAYAMAGEREKAIQAGCVDYVSKPIKPSQLMAVIHKCINGSR
ncbi:MAG: PAS domain S-box protein [Bacteroidales bacterium]